MFGLELRAGAPWIAERAAFEGMPPFEADRNVPIRFVRDGGGSAGRLAVRSGGGYL